MTTCILSQISNEGFHCLPSAQKPLLFFPYKKEELTSNLFHHSQPRLQQLVEDLLREEPEELIFHYFCEALYRLLNKEDFENQGPRSSKVFSYEIIVAYQKKLNSLDVADEEWMKHFRENPGYFSLELTEFIFSVTLEYLENFLGYLSTSSFYHNLKLYLEQNPQFCVSKFCIFFSRLYFIKCKEHISPNDLKEIVGIVVDVTKYRAYHCQSQDPNVEKMVTTIVHLRSHFPKGDEEVIKKHLEVVYHSEMKTLPKLLFTTLFELGDLIFSLHFPTYNEPFFKYELRVLLALWKQRYPFASHRASVSMIKNYLKSHPHFSYLSDKKLGVQAMEYYKTWWYTGNKSVSCVSVLDFALEWHFIDLLNESNGVLSDHAFLSFLKKEMDHFYPLFPFHDAKAMHLISSCRKKFKKNEIIPQDPTSFFAEVKLKIILQREIPLDTYVLNNSVEIYAYFKNEIAVMGDVSYVYHPDNHDPLFLSSLLPLLKKLQMKSSFISHEEVIVQLKQELIKVDEYKQLESEALHDKATHFYKIWWYGHRTIAATATYAEVVLEWEALTFLADERKDLILENEALILLKDRMVEWYPAFPFNEVHASGFVKAFMALKQVAIYEKHLSSLLEGLKKIPQEEYDQESILREFKQNILIHYPKFPFDSEYALKLISPKLTLTF